MNRGGSSGGGQSSLGYLFGDNQKSSEPPASPSKSPINPPYGTDMDVEPPHPTNPLPSPRQAPNLPGLQDKNSNDHGSSEGQGQKLGNFLMERPSTKVKEAPGGSSSLGYLFGDK